MNERNFRIFLKKNEIDPVAIKNFISNLRDYENYLKNENLSLESVNPKKLVEYTEYLVSTNKNSVFDFLRAILNYANYSKKWDFVIETIDIIESYNAMDTLSARITKIHGEQIRNEIFRDLSIPPLGINPEKKPDFTKTIMKRVQDKLGKEILKELLSPCLHGRPPDDIEGDKELLAELGIDGFLSKKHIDLIKRLEKHREKGTLEFAQKVDNDVIKFVKNNQMIGSGLRKDNQIYISKIPYQTKSFLLEKDDRLKKFNLCYCPWIRGALKDGTEDELPTEFCNCSAGWYKLYWDQIFEEPVKVEPIKTALNGNLQCTFAIHIPEKILNKIKL
ncbi:MAG: acyl carrier protein [Candidatus Hermodarchaeota archaeon]